MAVFTFDFVADDADRHLEQPPRVFVGKWVRSEGNAVSIDAKALWWDGLDEPMGARFGKCGGEALRGAGGGERLRVGRLGEVEEETR